MVHFQPQVTQGGFSLIVTLILLVVVAIMGVGASQMVLLTERSTRFDRDYQIAFQAAEAALLDAEFDIRGPNASGSQRISSFSPKDVLGFTDECGTGTDRGKCNPAADGQNPVWYQVDFTDTSLTAKTAKFGEFTGRTFSTGNTGIRSEIDPRYIIEVLPDLSPGKGLDDDSLRVVFRVTAMGFGPRKETQAVAQMIFRKE